MGNVRHWKVTEVAGGLEAALDPLLTNLGFLLAGDNEVPGVFDGSLTFRELSTEGRDLLSGQGVGLLESIFLNVSSGHGVLESSIFYSDAGDLSTGTTFILLGHLHAKNTCAADFIIGHHGFLGVRPSIFSLLVGTGNLLVPLNSLLSNSTALAF